MWYARKRLCPTSMKYNTCGRTLYLTGVTFYGASLGKVRFVEPVRISDLEGVGLWSDFQNLAVGPQKVWIFMQFATHIPNLKSELRYLFIIFVYNPFKMSRNHTKTVSMYKRNAYFSAHFPSFFGRKAWITNQKIVSLDSTSKVTLGHKNLRRKLVFFDTNGCCVL